MHGTPQARTGRPSRPRRLAVSATDALLLVLTVIWGANFVVVKLAVAEIPPRGFNTLRLLVASTFLLVVLRIRRRPWPARPAWPRLALLAFVGQFLYQLAFLGGLARSSVANTSLILGCVPVAVLLLNAGSGDREPVRRLDWLGVGLSVFGVYVVAGPGSEAGRASLAGDLLTLASVWCWALYTVGSRSLLVHYSPLAVTGCSMALGTLFYAPFGIPDLIALDWARVSRGAWAGLLASGILSLGVAYVIWYTAIQRIGSARTAIYSNLTPVAAMTVASIWLQEPIGRSKIAGAVCILAGLALTRLERRAGVMPPEE